LIFISEINTAVRQIQIFLTDYILLQFTFMHNGSLHADFVCFLYYSLQITSLFTNGLYIFRF